MAIISDKYKYTYCCAAQAKSKCMYCALYMPVQSKHMRVVKSSNHVPALCT